MVIRISGLLIFLSVVFSVVEGNISAVSEAAINGCNRAVSVTFSLMGLICLWSGIMSVAKDGGVLRFAAKLCSPILKLVFPKAAKEERGISEIAAACVANMLGIGNACTPLAINAMKALSDQSGTASDDMVTFTVLGTAFPCLIPTTVIALRQASGSSSPTDIIVPVWICSLILSIFAVITCKALSSCFKKGKKA